ncbi:MAG: hypothetical protein HZB81_05450 [Deltaproteobacteria bacterium]|nr:hypothetical protein [Deltaproteobacteria bacterium]
MTSDKNILGQVYRCPLCGAEISVIKSGKGSLKPICCNTEIRKEQKIMEEKKEKKHVCSICGKPSEATICHPCEEKIRGEALEKKKEVDKAGRTDTGRR